MSPGPSKSYLETARESEARGNRDTRARWELWAQHRSRLTAAILESAPGGSLALLGVGNANDVDLDRLAEQGSEIDLIDIDPSALSRAIERARPETRVKLRTHGSIDLSGVYHLLDAQARRLRTPADVEALVDRSATELAQKLPRDRDLAVSCCVLTQMAWGIRRLLGEGHPLLPPFEQAIMRIHLRTLAAVTAPGKAALLVTDVVSSRTYPLEEEAAGDLTALLQRLVESELIYRSANPSVLRLALRRDRALSAAFEEARPGDPWLWTAAPDVTYLVYPLLLRRRS